MSQVLPLIKVTEIPTDGSAEVVANGRIFAVYRIEDIFYVLDGICPHAGGPLGKGTLNGKIVTCPWHGWQFDVATGHHCLNSRICQATYRTHIINDEVCIEIPA